MKYLGQHPRRCDCKYCVGNGDSKAVNKALRKKGRQTLKKETEKAKHGITDTRLGVTGSNPDQAE